MGIFVSTDPQNQLWNNYSYCAGNPIRLTDPTGGDISMTEDQEDVFDAWYNGLSESEQNYYDENYLTPGVEYSFDDVLSGYLCLLLYRSIIGTPRSQSIDQDGMFVGYRRDCAGIAAWTANNALGASVPFTYPWNGGVLVDWWNQLPTEENPVPGQPVVYGNSHVGIWDPLNPQIINGFYCTMLSMRGHDNIGSCNYAPLNDVNWGFSNPRFVQFPGGK